MPATDSIDPSLTMREVLARFPGAQRALFRRYHIGGCSSCGFQPEETLAAVCARNDGVSAEDAAAHIVASHESDLQQQIAPADAAEMVKAGTARLVDIRTREEFDAVHAEGATFFTQELMHELGGWDRATLIVFVDHDGSRSMDACAYFAGHGLENVRALRGGIDAWSQEVDANLPRYELE